MDLLRDRRTGYALAILGVAANNWVYLNDIVFDKHEGFIWLGDRGLAGVVASVLLIAAGLFLICRAGRPGG